MHSLLKSVARELHLVKIWSLLTQIFITSNMRHYLKYLRRYSMHPAHSDIFSTSADSQYKAKIRLSNISLKTDDISKARRAKCYKTVISTGNSPYFYSVCIVMLISLFSITFSRQSKGFQTMFKIEDQRRKFHWHLTFGFDFKHDCHLRPFHCFRRV